MPPFTDTTLPRLWSHYSLSLYWMTFSCFWCMTAQRKQSWDLERKVDKDIVIAGIQWRKLILGTWAVKVSDDNILQTQK